MTEFECFMEEQFVIKEYLDIDQEFNKDSKNAQSGKAVAEAIDNIDIAKDWNQNDPTASDYIKNRTHYMSKSTESITFDGNLDNYTVIDAYEGDFKLVKVSDDLLSVDDLIGTTVTFTHQDGSTIDHYIGGKYVIEYGNNIWVNTDDNDVVSFVVYSSEDAAADIGGNPEDIPLGTYFAYAVENYDYYVSSLSSVTTTIKKIDEKYLPELAYVKKQKTNGYTYQVYAIDSHSDGEYNDTTLDVEDHTQFEHYNNYGQIPQRQVNGNLFTNTPVNYLDCTNKKYVDDAIKNINIGDIDTDVSGKLDKIPSLQTKNLENVNGWIGAYVTNDTAEGNARLARVHHDWEPYTIPYRLASGQIHVGLSGWDEINKESKIFQDAAVPKSYLSMVRTVLENSINALDNDLNEKIKNTNTEIYNMSGSIYRAHEAANNAQVTADNKKFTSSYTRVETILEYNSLYILWANSGNADIMLYNSETGDRIVDTANDKLAAGRVVMLFLPESSNEIFANGSSKDTARRCLYLGVQGISSFESKQFIMTSGNVKINSNTTGITVFKLKL